MGLLTTHVEISLQTDVSYYENLGYTIPREKNQKGRMRVVRGTTITISVFDLKPKSSVHVSVKCDRCTRINNNIIWADYLKYRKDENTYFCKQCNIDTRCILFENGAHVSFETWCLNNNKKNILQLWDYDLNNKTPIEITTQTDKKYYFKCPRNLHASQVQDIGSITKGSISVFCNKCNSFAQWGIDNIGEDFLEKYWDYEKNKNIDPWVISYGSNKKVFVKCQNNIEHGSYTLNCNAFTSNDSRCPKCLRSKGETKIAEFLTRNNIEFETQKKFPNLVGVKGSPLSYDFYLPTHNLLIEYQGDFHTRIKTMPKQTIEDAKLKFDKQQKHDKRKKEYAGKNNITLLEIFHYGYKSINTHLQWFFFDQYLEEY